jgi:hypothetical protein
MLRLTCIDDRQDEPDSLLFPTEAVRQLTAGRNVGDGEDSIDRVERALEAVESNFRRLRMQAEWDDDRPRAA